MEGAGLQVANLSRAVLKNTNFKGADLKGANLRYVTGLTKEQMESTLIDRKTLLPHYLKIKWITETNLSATILKISRIIKNYISFRLSISPSNSSTVRTFTRSR